jgi:hypothetical protein
VRRWATVVWIFAMLSLWLILSGAVMWRGGWTVGPRYLGAAPPFFAYGATCALERIAQNRPLARGISRGLSAGLAVASVASIGFVSLVYNTLPPSLLHPLTQFALPLARAGFVGHHVMEWIGWSSTTYWYIAVVALFAAPLLAGGLRLKSPDLLYGIQLSFLILALGVGLWPQFGKRKAKEPSFFELRPFIDRWEPKGRDRITRLRDEAERYGPRRPCLWHKLADLEALVHLTSESTHDRERAGAPRAQCPKGFLGP